MRRCRRLSGTSGLVLDDCGPGAWRAIDERFAHDDARCLVAYIEYTGAAYCIVSLIPPLGETREAWTLAEALEVAQQLRGNPAPGAVRQAG